MKNKKYSKKCPKCGNTQYYTYKRGLIQAKKKSSLCSSCGTLGKSKYNYSNFTTNFFSTIDTEEKAYILGFLFADGNVRKDSNNIRICLQEEDKDLLKKIKEEMDLENPINHRDYSGQKSIMLSFHKKEIKEDLIKHGCVPNKSLILEPPKGVPDNLTHHFIRGYFDGDGGFSYSKYGNCDRLVPYFYILSTKEVLSWINNYLPKKCGIHKNTGCYVLSTKSRNKVNKIGNYIYNNSNLFLKRKRDKFIKIKEYNNNFIPQNCTKVRHKKSGDIFNSIKEASKSVEEDYELVRLRLRKGYSTAQFEYVDK